MQPKRDHSHPLKNTLPKCPTGIQGLDEVTRGGIPLGRPTLVCGSAGSGKTLLGLEFLLRGIIEYGEPGVLMTFEETPDELASNMRSLGFDLEELIEQKRLIVDFVRIEPYEIEETGDYDLEGLFVRLNHAIDTLGAKRVMLDTIEALFVGLSNTSILRAELRRLFRWLKEKGVTAVITGERGDGALTRQGLEEYVSDCVIFLDHRVTEQISTRRLRIVKYRGSTHGTNEFPFLISEDGISVIPITSAEMEHPATNERISTGLKALDEMLNGGGYFRGSSVLVSGTAGTGKTSIAAQFAVAACERGEKCLFVSFEESPLQLSRNLHSIGLNLWQWIDQDLLRIHATRPTNSGLEMHLAKLHRQIMSFQPSVVVIDPISNFVSAGTTSEAAGMLIRLMDFLKSRSISSLFTDLTHRSDSSHQTDIVVSSIIDTWLVLRDVDLAGERMSQLIVLKSRGMAHSKKARDIRITNHGVELALNERFDPPTTSSHSRP